MVRRKIPLTGNELRKKYLDFFESKGHLVLPSASLVPDNDPSLLLIGAGMAPFKAFFTGKMMPPKTRVVTSQKCIRTGDIENVGRTARHHTFFEMLGNFSFGDYFKKETIAWAWEFLTSPKHLNLPKDALWVTIHPDDEEAAQIWHEEIGLPIERIIRLEDNFWEIGAGPCGPCSEIFIDLGEERGCHSEDCQAGCDCDRYLEIWNLVFTQFDNDGQGNYSPLSKKNIDTGAGLERLASVLQKKPSNFETDLLFPIIEKACKEGQVVYGKSLEQDVSLKVLADHSRAMVFMIADGILPSNEGRGYVLRRLIRRAIRHARLLGIQQPLLASLATEVFEIMKTAYPDLLEKADFIRQIVNLEEKRFQETLQSGTELLSREMDRLKEENSTELDGASAFKLYDTYGFPWELTAEILAESDFTLDKSGFDKAMKEQQERARAARQDVEAAFQVPDLRDNLKITTIFDEKTKESKIALIFAQGEVMETASDGETVGVILEATSFYAESGGQQGDTGIFTGPFGKMTVETTRKLPDGTIYHLGIITEGSLSANEKVVLGINKKERRKTTRNHTATHLLHAALKRILGAHVNQAGSQVSSDRLRFDFSHFSAPTSEELEKVERQVNWAISEEIPVQSQYMNLEEAKAAGAMALFGEKYGDEVRVLTIGDESMELCGGTHVKNTSEILLFKIVSEGGIGSGIRRIEAITGEAAYQWTLERQQILERSAKLLKVKPEDITQRLEQLQDEYKEVQKNHEKLREVMLNHEVEGMLVKVQHESIGNLRILATTLEATSMEELRIVGDMLKRKGGSYVALLAAKPQPDKVLWLALASADAVAQGAHAGMLVKTAAQITGGNGGGKPDMAQAGGNDPNKIREAIQAALETLREQLS